MSDTVTITGDQAEVKKDAGGLKEGVVYTQILYVFPDHRVNAPSPFATESCMRGWAATRSSSPAPRPRSFRRAGFDAT
jgi:hypothetical protein